MQLSEGVNVSAELNLSRILRGDTVPFSILFKDALSSPISVDGKTLVMTFKKSPLLKDQLSDLIIEVPLTDADPENPTGLVQFSIEASQTSKLYAGITYYHSIGLVTPAEPEDVVETYMAGTIEVGDT